MKCPKCNYISFDYNQSCPKCKKALAEVREKMDLPSFKPSPLFSSNLDRQTPTESIKMEQKKGFDMEETTEIEFSDSRDFDFPPESDSTEKLAESDMDLSLDDVSDELSLGFDDFPMDEEASVTPQKEHGATEEDSFETDLDFSLDDESDELSLDFDEPAIGEDAPETESGEHTIAVEDTLDADMDFSFDDESDELLPDLDEPVSDQDASEALHTENETGVEDSLEATQDLSFEKEIDEPIPVPIDPVNEDAEAEASQGEEETDGDADFHIDLKLDEEDDNKQSVFLEPSEEDEVTAAFDFGDLSMDEQGTDIEGAIADDEEDQLSLDLEESVSPVEENADVTNPILNIKEEQGKNISSDLEVLDLDLDLEQPDDK